MIDLAYIGTKTLINLGYYVAKGTYNTVAYLTGNDLIEEKETNPDKILLDEIKSLRSEMDGLRKEIKQIHDDSFLLVDKHEETRIIANVEDEIGQVQGEKVSGGVGVESFNEITL